jgi:hypothetical protein
MYFFSSVRILEEVSRDRRPAVTEQQAAKSKSYISGSGGGKHTIPLNDEAQEEILNLMD